MPVNDTVPFDTFDDTPVRGTRLLQDIYQRAPRITEEEVQDMYQQAAQVDQESQIKMIQVKEMMQDNDLKNSKSKDKGSRSQSMNEQSQYKQDKTKTRQSINVKSHIFNVRGDNDKAKQTPTRMSSVVRRSLKKETSTLGEIVSLNYIKSNKNVIGDHKPLEKDSASQWIRRPPPKLLQTTQIPVYPEVRDPKILGTVKEEMLLDEAIAANISRGKEE
ncbi:hypothetical protein Tco_0080560 [Tanacetum coccineum]